jgi:malonyl-CoA O-methyltransferase
MPGLDAQPEPLGGLDARAVEHVLGRLAASEQAPWLHREVARRMAERLPIIRQAPRQWLDWWAHLGGGASAVCAAYPLARRIAVEPTPALRARSLMQLPAWWSPRRWTSHTGATILQSQVAESAADMLWANMMLHACADIPGMLSQWHRALSVDGFVMFSTLGPYSLRELGELYRQCGFGPPHYPFVDMHDLGDLMVHAGFADPVMDQELLTLTWSTPEAALAELRALGGNAHPQRHAGLRTPRWRDRLLGQLEQRLDGQGRLAMSFEIVYGHAFRPESRARVAALSAISLSDMRTSLSRRRSAG